VTVTDTLGLVPVPKQDYTAQTAHENSALAPSSSRAISFRRSPAQALRGNEAGLPVDQRWQATPNHLNRAMMGGPNG